MRRFILALFMAALLLLPAASLGEEGALTISLIGDCSIGEAYSYRHYAGSYTRTVDEKGFDWPFSLVRKYLDADDLTVANLEVVFTSLPMQRNKKIALAADPKYVGVLLESGIDAVNTANNHSFDFLLAGYMESMKTLDGAGIPHFGTLGLDTKSPVDDLLVKEVKGVRIGFVGFSYPQPEDKERIALRIQALRDQGCQLVIASLHWGREEHDLPGSGQYAYAQAIIDAGADVVYGHHPHVLQPIHIYKGKPIFYSTGNFTFGTIGAMDPSTGIFQLRYSLTANGPALANLTVIPCRTQGSKDYRPYELTQEKDRARVFSKLVFKRKVEGMENLPPSFLDTGSVDFVDGEMVGY